METIGKGKPAHDLFRRILCPQIFQALVPVPFGKAAAIRGQQERTVGELRRFQTQQTVKIKLPGGGREQVRAPHHLRHAHAGIVHHHSQLVGKHAIGAAEVEIPAVAEQVLGVGAHTAIGEGDVLIGHHETVGRGFLFALLGDLLRRQPPAGAGIDHIAVGGVGCAGGMELGTGTEAGVHKALCFQFVIALGVNVGALALVIGAVGAAAAAALVPDKAQPFQIFFQRIGVFPGAALGIQILNAQNDASALTSGAEPGQQAAGQIAQMEPTAGAGGKAPGHSAHRPSFHSPSTGWEMGVL